MCSMKWASHLVVMNIIIIAVVLNIHVVIAATVNYTETYKQTSRHMISVGNATIAEPDIMTRRGCVMRGSAGRL